MAGDVDGLWQNPKIEKRFLALRTFFEIKVFDRKWRVVSGARVGSAEQAPRRRIGIEMDRV